MTPPRGKGVNGRKEVLRMRERWKEEKEKLSRSSFSEGRALTVQLPERTEKAKEAQK